MQHYLLMDIPYQKQLQAVNSRNGWVIAGYLRLIFSQDGSKSVFLKTIDF
jgi:hypothetical protein